MSNTPNYKTWLDKTMDNISRITNDDPSQEPSAQEVINTLTLANRALQNEVLSLRAAVGSKDSDELNKINSVLIRLQKHVAVLQKERDVDKARVRELEKELESWEKGSAMLPGNRLNTVD